MRSLLSTVLLLGTLTGPVASQDTVAPSALMPRPMDYTSMWWTEGFPGTIDGAPWLRCVQTGYYAMVVDTETMRIPHFGPVTPGTSYAMCDRGDPRAWASLPPAELTLAITADGKTYRCTEGGKWSRFTGPRLIESGRFLQRADVTDLVFRSESGERLNVEARFETAAWADRLGLILAARPGIEPIVAGEASFGKIGGGFGLDGTNHLEIPHAPDLDPEGFTFELWAFVPPDHQASKRASPWLFCKNRNEAHPGNIGIIIRDGKPEARMNIGGGRDGQFRAPSAQSVKLDAWNHLAISYDGDTLRLYLNGSETAKQHIGRKRAPGRDGLAIGRRQDNSGDGYHFRGVIDEIRIHDRTLKPDEIHWSFAKPETPAAKPVRTWSFRADGTASPGKPGTRWKTAAMEIRLRTARSELRQAWQLPADEPWSSREWNEVHLALDPVAFQATAASPLTVTASEIPNGRARPVEFSPSRGWHCVNLDRVEAIVPKGGHDRKNDAMERIKLVLSNPTDRARTARLMFEKSAGGFSVTGISAILRGTDGQPTGIPVQLSKNWHNDPRAGVYSGTWFHGVSQVRLPAGAKIELELSIVYGHWGGVAAASHAQLCLIGWGSNQRWDESALGSWGESICYEPSQGQAQASILDVRPVMVGFKDGAKSWSWTSNVGGGDWFRLFDKSGTRVPPAAMRATYHRHGPCLTEVTYSGRLGGGITHAASASLARTDDIVRGIYRLRLDAKQAVGFSRLAIFQVGADTYNFTREGKLAIGDESGLRKEWEPTWGGDVYQTAPMECTGRIPWMSLHEGAPRASKDVMGAWANRGIVIRAWNARLGGKTAKPWVAEHGTSARGGKSSTLDIVPPPGVTRLEPGDFVEATIEYIVMPQFAKGYYGPNEALRAALAKDGNIWRMIHREAAGNDRSVTMTTGTLEHLHPDVRIRTGNREAAFTLTGGLGHVPVTFTELSSGTGYTLVMDGKPVDQATHGSDFWQTDYDPQTQRWSQTYNIPVAPGKTHTLQLITAP